MYSIQGDFDLSDSICFLAIAFETWVAVYKQILIW
jgi:hypothetical protein